MKNIAFILLALPLSAQAEVTIACKCVAFSGLCGTVLDLSGATTHDYKVYMSSAPSGSDKQHLLNLACWNLADDEDREMCCPVEGDNLDKLVKGTIVE